MLSQHPKAGFFYQKQPLRVPEERNVRPCEELALPFIRLRVKICQLLRNTTFRGHNSTIRSRPDPLRAFTGSGCGYARLYLGMIYITEECNYALGRQRARTRQALRCLSATLCALPRLYDCSKRWLDAFR